MCVLCETDAAAGLAFLVSTCTHQNEVKDAVALAGVLLFVKEWARCPGKATFLCLSFH